MTKKRKEPVMLGWDEKKVRITQEENEDGEIETKVEVRDKTEEEKQKDKLKKH